MKLKILLYFFIFLSIELSAFAKSKGDSPDTVLTLKDALEKAIEASPSLRSATSVLKAAEGAAQQAGVWRNPSISVDIQNFSGSGDFKNTENAEITYSISQLIEIGGKTTYRRQVAQQAVLQGEYDLAIARLNLIRDVNLAFANSVYTQRMLELAKERRDLEEAMIVTVRQRVNLASTPAIQLRKAEIGLSTAQLFVKRIEREFDHTKHVLSSLWVGHDKSFSLDDSKFDEVTAPPSEETVEAMLLKAVDFLRRKTEKNRAEATLRLEIANAIPDPTFSFGIRDIKRSDDRAFIAGVSFPIPVFNRNHGNIENARHTINSVESDQEANRIDLQNEVFEWLESEVNAYHEAKTLKSDIIPTAKKAFELARAGYERGRFPYLEVLDAQRVLFEAKEQYIKALREYHTASAQVDRFTTPSGEIKND